MSLSWTPSVLASALVIALAGAAPAQEMDKSPGANWPTYGGSYGQRRFSRLTQVSTKNVRKLRVAWTYAVPDAGVEIAVRSELQLAAIVIREFAVVDGEKDGLRGRVG